MRRICFVCKKQYGLKEPLSDDSETHGYCPDCYQIELKKLEEYRKTGIHPWKKLDPEA